MNYRGRDKNQIRQCCKISDYLGISYSGRGSILVEHPFREDSHPSFSVFTGKNGNQLWGDFSTGKTGDIIQLHIEITACSFGTACKFLGEEWNHTVPFRQCHIVTQGAPGKSHAKKAVRETTEAKKNSFSAVKKDSSPPYCGTAEVSNYLRDTGLIMPEWIAVQVGAYTDQRSNLVYQMTNGDFHIRGTRTREGRRFAGNSGEVSFTVFGNTTSPEWVVTEGIGDVLALLSMAIVPEAIAFMVLNSTSTTSSALQYIQARNVTNIMLFLDNDPPKLDGSRTAGDLATAKFMAAFPTAAKDMRGAYKKHKDPLEWMQFGKFGKAG